MSDMDLSLKIVARFLLFIVAAPFFVAAAMTGLRIVLAPPQMFMTPASANHNLLVFVIFSIISLTAAVVSIAFSLNR